MSVTEGNADPVTTKVERMREALLDLTNRNKLLNFEHSDRARTHIRVIDEVPEFLFDALVGGRELKFKGFERPATKKGDSTHEMATSTPTSNETEVRWQDVAADLGVDVSVDLPVPSSAPPARHRDNAIQVPYFADVAERKLEGIRQTYRSLLEETGVPALFGAFGFLEWYEAENAEAQLAPLVLLPLEIERTKAGYRYEYRLRANDEDPQANQSLQMRLSRLGVQLPAMDDEDSDASLSRYLERVAKQISHMPRWQVRRYVTVGIFHFARQVMYQDLEPERWTSGGGLQSHPLLPAILGLASPGPSFKGNPIALGGFAQDLVTDSDQSQREAIAQALGGGSMVIKGPPGTGKSQTITNLIAAALGANKTVLFVADKMAALNVVKKRLDDVGLGSFCLELHSSKTKKKEFIDELERAFNVRKEVRRPHDAAQLVEGMARIEKEIGAYDRAMSTPVGALGESLKDLVWSAERLRAQMGQLPERLGDVTISGAESITREQLDNDRAALHHLETVWWAVADSAGKTHRHPWRFVERSSLSIAEQDRLLGATRDWLRALESIESAMADIPGASLRMSGAALRRICTSIAGLPTIQAGPAKILRRLASDTDTSALEHLVTDVKAFQTTKAALSALTTNVDATIGAADAATTLHTELQSLSGEVQTIGQVQERLGEWRRQVVATEECGRLVADVAQRCQEHGRPRASSAAAVRSILFIVGCLRGQPKRILQLRSDSTLDISLAVKFQEMAEYGGRLHKERDSLDTRYTGWHAKTSADLREMAFTLRSASLLQRWFGAKYSAARLGFERLTTGRKARRLEMADQLERLANFAAIWDRWPSSDDFRSIVGQADRGMSTDFGGLLACSQWAGACRRQGADLGSDARWALDCLFHEPWETLEVLETSVSPIHVDRLTKWVSENPEGDVGAWAARKHQQLDRIEAATTALRVAGVRTEAPLSRLPHIHRLSSDLVRLREAVNRNGRGVEVAGPDWAGVETALDPFVAASAARRQIAALALPMEVARYLFEDPSVRLGSLRAIGAKLAPLLAGEDGARSVVEGLGVAVERVSAENGEMGATLDVLRAAVSTPEHLAEWVSFRRAWDEAILSNGPRAFLNGLDWSEIPPEQLSAVYELAVYRSLCSFAQGRFPELSRGTWSGAQLSRGLEKHATLDLESLALQRDALRFRLAQKEIPEGRGSGRSSSDLTLIRHEGSKKTRHQSIRKLMRHAFGAIQCLKPCFMMSPLSVAQYLEGRRMSFDMVVIDEASQMRPAEALGALLRGHQIVVVGDRQQLPPSAFFEFNPSEDDGDSEDELGGDIDNTESILDLMAATQPPTCDLRWHYRSRHESLIQFSNEQFYDGRLHVLPSPSPGRMDLGVHGRYVEGLYSKSTNLIEAAAVVEAALTFMRATPERSLGIVAMNQKQAEQIQGLIDESLRKADIGFVDRWKDTLEPFFVKNLENVQGDERDVIFISLTYGPAAVGAKPAQNFGPVNRAMGHRRLNVLFTRAKSQVVLFSSMRPEQVEVRATSQRGVRVLHDYLKFAFSRPFRDGVVDHSVPAKHPRSTQHLGEELARYGLQVKTGIGGQNIELPIAVVHPDTPGSYACVVECDGNSDQTAHAGEFRERARVFPKMLESFGWRRLGTWTADWLRNPFTAHQELLRGLEASVARPLNRRADIVPTDRSEPIAWAAVAEVPLSSTVPTLPGSRFAMPNSLPGAGDADQTEAPTVKLIDVEHPLMRKLSVTQYFASARKGETWNRLVLPLIALLVSQGGSAPFESVAQALGFPAYRIRGVLAEVQEQLNAGQHQVLRCDRDAGQVRLDIILLEQLADMGH